MLPCVARPDGGRSIIRACRHSTVCALPHERRKMRGTRSITRQLFAPPGSPHGARSMISRKAYLQIFNDHGVTDVGYLHRHWPRFRNTKEIFERGVDTVAGKRVLDVGAHWLHQAMLFALDGYQVTAVDFPETIQAPSVESLARAHDIRLVSCADLAHPVALSHLLDGSFDVIIFGEILEHIAFNPVALWRELYRLLAEGGRIVVTTPNCYAATRRRLRELRYWIGGGAGITVDEILTTPSHGHHWKEYSRREVERYFKLLSPDFVIHRSIYVEDESSPDASPGQRLSATIRRSIPVLRSRLHVEVSLPAKRGGVVVEQHWS